MSEESRSDVSADSKPASSENSASQPAAAEPRETGTGRILREAIHRVMDEIEHHKKEAQKHLQQVEELKRDLRESFACFPEQQITGKRADASLKSRHEEPATAPQKDKDASKRPRPGAKRK
jgi:type I site-specific restriction endonuclease